LRVEDIGFRVEQYRTRARRASQPAFAPAPAPAAPAAQSALALALAVAACPTSQSTTFVQNGALSALFRRGFFHKALSRMCPFTGLFYGALSQSIRCGAAFSGSSGLLSRARVLLHRARVYGRLWGSFIDYTSLHRARVYILGLFIGSILLGLFIR